MRLGIQVHPDDNVVTVVEEAAAGEEIRFVASQGAEQLEALEQLRALWNGHRIHVFEAETAPPAGVDTAEDLRRVEQCLTGHGLG